MKRSILLMATFCALLIPVFSYAQTSETSTLEEQTNKSLDIARNIMKAAQGLTNDFADFKGDFLQKTDNGNSFYMAKGLEMGTGKQYIIVKSNGAVTYAVIFEPKDADDKTPILAFTAFTGGILTLAHGADTGVSVEQDPAGTQGTTLKYFLKAKDIKIASFSFDTSTKSGTLLVAIQ